MTRTQIIKKIKQHKVILEKKFSICRIGLFGSYSSNTFHEKSDIDLIYELEEGARLGFKEVCELETYMKELLETDQIDLVNQRYINPIIEDEMEKTLIYV